MGHRDRPTTHRPLSPWRRLFYTGPSTDVLYEDYARRGRIDNRTPISTALRDDHRRTARASLGTAQPTTAVGTVRVRGPRRATRRRRRRRRPLHLAQRQGQAFLPLRRRRPRTRVDLDRHRARLPGRTPPPPHPDEQQPDTPRQRGVDGRPPPRPVLQQRQAPRLTQHLARRHHRRRATLDGLPTRAHPSPVHLVQPCAHPARASTTRTPSSEHPPPSGCGATPRPQIRRRPLRPETRLRSTPLRLGPGRPRVTERPARRPERRSTKRRVWVSSRKVDGDHEHWAG